MTIHDTRGAKPERAQERSILKTVHVPQSDDTANDLLQRELQDRELSHIFVFASEAQAFQRIANAAHCFGGGATVSGCRTAGQLSRFGYDDENAILIGLPKAQFETTTVAIASSDLEDGQTLIDRLVQARVKLQTACPDKPNGFAFLLVNGLSLREDILAAAVAPAIGAMPLFGGSSGDGLRFEATELAHDGEISENLALLTFVVTNCDTQVFSLNHLTPIDRKMVVTSADPEQRIVKEINAVPAGREYARMVNCDPDQLDEFTFSAFPVVVQLGDTYHVRSIQRVNEKGELVFFAAIDEGMVLTIARAENIAEHLDRELNNLTAQYSAAEILGCDCILRRIEASQSQSMRAVSNVLMKNRVVGFSTYGEQIGPLHVNHTMTGVVLAWPDE
ncbi:MAG: FIST N-terminal domain-containing protein [Arenibacterium sp.]